MKTLNSVVPSIAKLIRQKYLASGAPVILYWRQLVCECIPAYNSLWPKHCQVVTDHLAANFPKLKELLAGEGIAVVKCNKRIKQFRVHGSAPDQDENANAGWYKSCIPASHAPGFGIVCFPSNSIPDHPLLVAKFDRVGKDAETRLVGYVNGVSTATNRGHLSQDEAHKLVSPISSHVMPVIEDQQQLEYRSEE
jgi:hypothetical protein